MQQEKFTNSVNWSNNLDVQGPFAFAVANLAILHLHLVARTYSVIDAGKMVTWNKHVGVQ